MREVDPKFGEEEDEGPRNVAHVDNCSYMTKTRSILTGDLGCALVRVPDTLGLLAVKYSALLGSKIV